MARCIKGKCRGVIRNDNDKRGAGCLTCGAAYEYVQGSRAKPIPVGWDPKKYRS